MLLAGRLLPVEELITLSPRLHMLKRIAAGFAVVAAGLAFTGSPELAAQPKTDKGQPKADKGAPTPKFLYGHDLKVRPGTQRDWDKAAKIGVEVFQDEGLKATIAISEHGAIAAFPIGPVGNDKSSKWVTAHDLKVRKAGEAEFTQKTRTWGVEVFRDLGSNRLLYVSEAGGVAFAPVPGNFAGDKGPKWHHGIEPKVRGLEAVTFDNARKFGLEVFKDENTGGLVYITETGAISTAAAPPTAPDARKVVPPVPVYGYTLRVRGGDEAEFSEKTKKVSVEVFEDPNANTLLYITDTGSIGVMPNLPRQDDKKGPPIWKGAISLKARKGGEKEFDKAKKYGVEVFEDGRTGNLMFISETGSIAVMK